MNMRPREAMPPRAKGMDEDPNSKFQEIDANDLADAMKESGIGDVNDEAQAVDMTQSSEWREFMAEEALDGDPMNAPEAPRAAFDSEVHYALYQLNRLSWSLPSGEMVKVPLTIDGDVRQEDMENFDALMKGNKEFKARVERLNAAIEEESESVDLDEIFTSFEGIEVMDGDILESEEIESFLPEEFLRDVQVTTAREGIDQLEDMEDPMADINELQVNTKKVLSDKAGKQAARTQNYDGRSQEHVRNVNNNVVENLPDTHIDAINNNVWDLNGKQARVKLKHNGKPKLFSGGTYKKLMANNAEFQQAIAALELAFDKQAGDEGRAEAEQNPMANVPLSKRGLEKRNTRNVSDFKQTVPDLVPSSDLKFADPQTFNPDAEKHYQTMKLDAITDEKVKKQPKPIHVPLWLKRTAQAFSLAAAVGSVNASERGRAVQTETNQEPVVAKVDRGFIDKVAVGKSADNKPVLIMGNDVSGMATVQNGAGEVTSIFGAKEFVLVMPSGASETYEKKRSNSRYFVSTSNPEHKIPRVKVEKAQTALKEALAEANQDDSASVLADVISQAAEPNFINPYADGFDNSGYRPSAENLINPYEDDATPFNVAEELLEPGELLQTEFAADVKDELGMVQSEAEYAATQAKQREQDIETLRNEQELTGDDGSSLN